MERRANDGEALCMHTNFTDALNRHVKVCAGSPVPHGLFHLCSGPTEQHQDGEDAQALPVQLLVLVHNKLGKDVPQGVQQSSAPGLGEDLPSHCNIHLTIAIYAACAHSMRDSIYRRSIQFVAQLHMVQGTVRLGQKHGQSMR